jgi:hypothetical protein
LFLLQTDADVVIGGSPIAHQILWKAPATPLEKEALAIDKKIQNIVLHLVGVFFDSKIDYF